MDAIDTTALTTPSATSQIISGRSAALRSWRRALDSPAPV